MAEFRCVVCGRPFQNQADAAECKKRGITMFSKRVGERVQFSETKKIIVNGPWVQENKAGIVKRVNFLFINQFPGHDYGIAALSYLVLEDSGLKSWQNSLENDMMRTVSVEQFIIDIEKMDPGLSGTAKKLRKQFSVK